MWSSPVQTYARTVGHLLKIQKSCNKVELKQLEKADRKASQSTNTSAEKD
jgi:hypothetical protein